MRIEFNLRGVKPFEISYDSFVDLYLEVKQDGFDQFQINAFEVLPLKRKISYNKGKEESVMVGMVEKLRKKVDVYDHLEDDNVFLKAATDIYSLIGDYERKMEKQIRKVLDIEYKEMVERVEGGV